MTAIPVITAISNTISSITVVSNLITIGLATQAGSNRGCIRKLAAPLLHLFMFLRDTRATSS